MKTLKYVGPSHFRKITATEFPEELKETRDVFVRGQIATLEQIQNFGKGSSETVEVLDTTAEWLLKWEPADWEVVQGTVNEEQLQSQRLDDQLLTSAADGEDAAGDVVEPSNAPADGGEGRATRSGATGRTKK